MCTFSFVLYNLWLPRIFLTIVSCSSSSSSSSSGSASEEIEEMFFVVNN